MNRLIIICLLLSLSGFSQADIAIVVSKDSAISNASVEEIERLYLGKSKSVAGVDMVPVNQKDSGETANEFNRIVLNKSSSQVKAYWSKLVFTGKGEPPKEVDGNDKVIAEIRSNANVIGYVDAAAVTAAVKVIATLK